MSQNLSTMTCIEDLRVVAKRRVPRMFYDYADSGAWTEGTYRANESEFQKIKLRQRVAVNMDGRSLATTMAGIDVKMPVALAPTGLTGMQHADGEILAAQAAAEFGVPFTLSTMSICSIEDVAQATQKPFWFQLYVMRDREFIGNLIDRAKAAGCSALVLTLDLQIMGQRHKDIKNGLSAPPKLTLANMFNLAFKPRWCLGMLGTKRRTFGNIVGHAKGVTDLAALSSWTAEQFDPRLSWDDVAWIKERWGGKLILKGILDVEDARRAAATAPTHHRQQSWRTPARWRGVDHRNPAGHRQRSGLADRGLARQRHPFGAGRAQGRGAGRARHHDRARLPVWPGGLWQGGRDARAGNHLQRSGRDHGAVRPPQYLGNRPQHPGAGHLPHLNTRRPQNPQTRRG